MRQWRGRTQSERDSFGKARDLDCRGHITVIHFAGSPDLDRLVSLALRLSSPAETVQ